MEAKESTIPGLGALRMIAVLIWMTVLICVATLAVLLTLRRRTALYIARNIWAPGVLWLAGVEMERFSAPIDWDKPHVFVMNHLSMMDVPIAFALLPVDLHFVAKKSLLYVPFLGWYMWMTEMIFVDRGQRQKAVESIDRAAKRIRGGFSVLVYPEGTRSKTGQLQPFKRGAFALALSSGVPVVPIAIMGSDRILKPGRFSLSPGKVRARIGAPIPMQGRALASRAEVSAEVEAEIRRMLMELGQGF